MSEERELAAGFMSHAGLGAAYDSASNQDGVGHGSPPPLGWTEVQLG